MPGKQYHRQKGTLTALVVEMLCAGFDQLQAITDGSQSAFDWEVFLKRLAMASLGGFIGGQAPDLLEPAYHPNHRKFAHSMVFGTGVAAGTYSIQKTPLPPEMKAFFRGLGIGYLMHLLDDSRTPKGLPII